MGDVWKRYGTNCDLKVNTDDLVNHQNWKKLTSIKNRGCSGDTLMGESVVDQASFFHLNKHTLL